MKNYIEDLGYNLAVLAIIGFAAFAGQVTANHIPLFGKSSTVERLKTLEDRQIELLREIDQLKTELNKKIGF